MIRADLREMGVVLPKVFGFHFIRQRHEIIKRFALCDRILLHKENVNEKFVNKWRISESMRSCIHERHYTEESVSSVQERNLIPKCCPSNRKKIPSKVSNGKPKFFVTFGQRLRFNVSFVTVLFVCCDSFLG